MWDDFNGVLNSTEVGNHSIAPPITRYLFTFEFTWLIIFFELVVWLDTMYTYTKKRTFGRISRKTSFLLKFKNSVMMMKPENHERSAVSQSEICTRHTSLCSLQVEGLKNVIQGHRMVFRGHSEFRMVSRSSVPSPQSTPRMFQPITPSQLNRARNRASSVSAGGQCLCLSPQIGWLSSTRV